MSWILDRIFVVFGALLFLQFPLFMHQYQQQLIGHVHELQWQIDAMQLNAEDSGKSIDEYIQKFIDHTDRDIFHQGAVMKRVYSRWKDLSESLARLQQASVFTKPYVFLRYLQWDIFASASNSFEPGLTFTFEGMLYILSGILCGFLLFSILKGFGRKIFRKRSSKMASSTKKPHHAERNQPFKGKA